MLILPRLANPSSVMARSAASSIASELGAPTTAALCTSSNDSRPLTQQDARAQRQQTVEQRATDHPVHRVVPTDVLADDHEFAAGSERPGGVQSSCPVEHVLAQTVGKRGEER